MKVVFFALFSLVVAIFDAAATGKTMNCTFFAAVGPKGFTCDERSDIICTEGCKTFITSRNCTLPEYPMKPATNEVCTVGFGRDTAAAKACITGQGIFRCTGESTGTATCYGCVPINQVWWAN